MPFGSKRNTDIAYEGGVTRANCDEERIIEANLLFSSIVYDMLFLSGATFTLERKCITYPPDIFLYPLNTKTTKDKPDFQRSETTAEA
jgi:hypothetical protein